MCCWPAAAGTGFSISKERHLRGTFAEEAFHPPLLNDHPCLSQQLLPVICEIGFSLDDKIAVFELGNPLALALELGLDGPLGALQGNGDGGAVQSCADFCELYALCSLNH
jgi:hypothetical protein